MSVASGVTIRPHAESYTRIVIDCRVRSEAFQMPCIQQQVHDSCATCKCIGEHLDRQYMKR